MSIQAYTSGQVRRYLGHTRYFAPDIVEPPEEPLTLEEEMLADNPGGLWLMQETAGTTMTDSSGNGRHGIYTGVTVAQAALDANSDYSAAFTGGVSSYADVADGAWLDTDDWTVEMLVSWDDHADYRAPITRYASSTTFAWLFKAGGYSYMFAFNNSGTLYGATPLGTSLSANTTYLIAAKWESTANRLQIFYNGAQDHEIVTTGTARTGASGLRMGNSNGGVSYPFKGRMSHVGWWGSALSDERILAHAQAAGL